MEIKKIDAKLPLNAYRLLRTVAYCRVSTAREEQRKSLSSQIQYYTHLIQRTTQWEFAGVFFDNTSGRTIKKQHQMQKMLEMCRRGEIDLILTKSVSRFGRNTVDVLRIFNELISLGVDVYFELEQLHLSHPNAMFLLTVFAGLAQDESESKSFNIKWGLRHAYQSGASKAQNRPCYGYCKDASGCLVVHTQQAEVVQRIYHWRLEGHSLSAIAQLLKDHGIKSPRGSENWGKETISRILSNEKYIGNVLLQKTYVADFFEGAQVKNRGQLPQYLFHNNHSPIVSEMLFSQVQAYSARKEGP